MAASGNVRYSQLRSGDRSGTGAKVATVTGTLTTDKQLKFDSSGNVVASSEAIGSGSGQFLVSPIFTPTVPVSGDFAWINQGGASVTTIGNTIYLDAPYDSTNVRIRKKTAPATPYTITAAFIPHLPRQNFCRVGLVFRESGSGKLKTFAMVWNAAPYFHLDAWNSPTSINSTTASGLVYTEHVCFMQISDDGTDRKYRTSNDGVHWWQWYTETRTTFLTADEVGFFVSSEASGYDAGMLLTSWAQS